MIYTTLADYRYLPGLFALLQSIKDNGNLDPEDRFVVVYRHPRVATYEIGLQKIGLNLELLDGSALGMNTGLAGQEEHRWVAAADKLLLFRLPYDHPICYLDTDMLCLGSIRELRDMPHFSAAPDFGVARPLRLWEKHTVFNSGMMVFQPSETLFDEITRYVRNSSYNFSQGDQAVLNCFFYETQPHTVNLLDFRFNTLKRVKHHFPEEFDLQATRLLHFVGHKPWDEGAIDLPEEAPYRELNELWQHYYQRSLHLPEESTVGA